MQYNLTNAFFNNFRCFEDNTLPARAYFVPFKDMESCKKTSYLDERYESSLLKSLNGKWDFVFYDRVSNMPLDIDTDSMQFDSIKVPGCWQYQGYEKPFYINTRYMFDIKKMPYVPDDKGMYGKSFSTQNGQKCVDVYNSVGLYRKTFNLKKSHKNIITFLGVSSCIQLYLNGYYIGYAEGSHNTHEFDITNYIADDGKNELVALVYKWCNGTYLECQDMFRSNGIFRDVYITSYSENYVWDYKVNTYNTSPENYKIALDIDAIKSENVSVECSLYDGENFIESKVGDKAEFCLANPKLWSAEIPNLYTLYIELKQDSKVVQCIRQEVGIRNIRIADKVFYFNDMPIKIKGVNHHDTHESHGYTMTVEELLQDVKLMKELNVNSVRTSHYPPDPVMLKIANYEGLYIIDEADIETHGCYGSGRKPFPLPNQISNNKKWKAHLWDRIYRMYMRDKNNPCVTMWSLGNESGGWKNQDYCYAKLKELDPAVPIHYEAVCRTRRFNYDVISQMYQTTEFYEKYVAGKAPKKFYRAPFFQCEYAHAMGVGPGSLDVYWDLFYKSDSALGGCIWEWADHAVKTKKGYLYGGDHGEYAHDGNFCVDGLVYPDRRLSPSAYNMQAVYRPIRAYYIATNKYLLRNTNRFLSSKYIDIKWEYARSGEVIASGEIYNEIMPMGEIEVVLKHPIEDTTKDCYVNFVYTDKNTGKFIAKEQITLSKFIVKSPTPSGKEIIGVEENSHLNIFTTNVKVVFDMNTGKISSYKVGEKELLCFDKANKIFVPNIYRAMIDNYMYIDPKWRKLGFNDIQIQLANFEYKKLSNCLCVLTEEKLIGAGKIRFTVLMEYKIYDLGTIDIKATLQKHKAYDIPKFGLDLELPASCSQIEYYGMGPLENYSDMSAHATMGIYKNTAQGMYEHYIKPQDNGNRSECRWAKIVDEKGNGWAISGNGDVFNFNATNYCDKTLMNAKHDFELKPLDKTCVRIDAFVRGIGSNSCGPDTRVEYRHNSQEDITYEIRLKPILDNRYII